MTLQEAMTQLEAFGSEGSKNIYKNHGAQEPLFGVKVGDLKKIVKKVKKDHSLALELYATGNSDAMYLAGLIADETKMTKQELHDWVSKAYWYMLSEYAVASVAAETPYAVELAEEWIKHDNEFIASAGWATLANWVSIVPTSEIDLPLMERYVQKAAAEVHDAQNCVRYTMNGFVICVGVYVEELSPEAYKAAQDIGKVHVEMGKTACKVPLATTSIQKVVDMGRVGKKRKAARC